MTRGRVLPSDSTVLSGFFNAIFFVMLSSFLSAQSRDTMSARPSQVERVKLWTMFENMPKNWNAWGKNIFRSEHAEEWAWVGGLTLLTFATDDDTYTPADKFYKSSDDTRYWSDFFAEIGDGRTQFAVAGAFAAYGLAFDDNKAFNTGSQIVQAVFASGAVIQVLKHVTGRESPFVRTTPTGVWNFFPNQVDYHRFVPHYDAFPSGHICTSLATVIIIAENYPDNKWVKPVGYTLTTLVGLGMLNNGIHWISDYPLGLFIGYYFGKLAAHPEGYDWGGTDGGNARMKMSILPTITPSGGGLMMSVRF